jgi:hypothetical protein
MVIIILNFLFHRIMNLIFIIYNQKERKNVRPVYIYLSETLREM